jgi:hypothetical protein
MFEIVIPQFLKYLIDTYGSATVPIIGAAMTIKYLLDKDKNRESVHKIELEVERERIRSERKRGDELQAQLLEEARSHALLAEELRNALHVLAKGIK